MNYLNAQFLCHSFKTIYEINYLMDNYTESCDSIVKSMISNHNKLSNNMTQFQQFIQFSVNINVQQVVDETYKLNLQTKH